MQQNKWHGNGGSEIQSPRSYTLGEIKLTSYPIPPLRDVSSEMIPITSQSSSTIARAAAASLFDL